MTSITRHLAVLGLAIVALTGCTDSDGDTVDVFLSVSADTAVYSGDAATGTLTLTGIDHGVVFLTLSPEREAWTGSPAEVPDLFADQSLNSVVLLEASGEAVALALTEPSFDQNSGTLTFATAALANLDMTDSLNVHNDALVAASAGDWGSVNLFVDPVTTTRKTPGVYIATAPNECQLVVVNNLPFQTVTVSAVSPADASAWTIVPNVGDQVPEKGTLTATAVACDDDNPASITLELGGDRDEQARLTIQAGSVTLSYTGVADEFEVNYTISESTVTLNRWVP